jgi:hypothetical protein
MIDSDQISEASDFEEKPQVDEDESFEVPPGDRGLREDEEEDDEMGSAGEEEEGQKVC